MSFNLFGFDFIREDKIYGFWFGQVNGWKDFNRSLLCVHYDNAWIRVEICYFQFEVVL